MKTSVDIVRDNMWLTVLVATVGPGLITALIQYVLPGEEIGIIAILARIHRWTRTEGVRTQEGGVRKLQTRWSGLEFG